MKKLFLLLLSMASFSLFAENEGLWDAFKEDVEHDYEKAKDALEGVFGEENREKAKEDLEKKADEAWEKTKDAAGDLKEHAASGWDKVRDWFKKTF